MSMSKKIRVLIVDDHFATRLGLSVPINAEKDMAVIAEAGTGAKAVEQFRLHRPDVVLMDYDLPDQNGVQTMSIIRNEFPDARVLMLTILDKSNVEVPHFGDSSGLLADV
jgi:DNA-binding NarL/FixJ family response regulator